MIQILIHQNLEFLNNNIQEFIKNINLPSQKNNDKSITLKILKKSLIEQINGISISLVINNTVKNKSLF